MSVFCCGCLQSQERGFLTPNLSSAWDLRSRGGTSRHLTAPLWRGRRWNQAACLEYFLLVYGETLCTWLETQSNGKAQATMGLLIFANNDVYNMNSSYSSNSDWSYWLFLIEMLLLRCYKNQSNGHHQKVALNKLIHYTYYVFHCRLYWFTNTTVGKPII